jgi:hypothetical protein
MKYQSTIGIALLFVYLLTFSSCKQNKKNEPCNNNGTICFNNKTDSTVKISITEAHNQFDLIKDNLKCITIEGDKAYTLHFLGKKYQKDTSIVLVVCDQRDYVIIK